MCSCLLSGQKLSLYHKFAWCSFPVWSMTFCCKCSVVTCENNMSPKQEPRFKGLFPHSRNYLHRGMSQKCRVPQLRKGLLEHILTTLKQLLRSSWATKIVQFRDAWPLLLRMCHVFPFWQLLILLLAFQWEQERLQILQLMLLHQPP